ncbi:MAG: hypothetical protein O3B13_00580 [Planctomycetota bacterium]|nr:hypothetical protein [Planctomycetota bacterium]
MGILLEIAVVMCGLFVWGLYDYKRAPRKLSAEQRKKLKSIAKAWSVTPDHLQNKVIPQVTMVASGLVGSICAILWTALR